MNRPAVYPPFLRPGGRLGLLSPSSPADDARFDRGVDWLQRQGFSVECAASAYSRKGLHTLRPAERAEEVHRFFADDSIDAILCVRGGSGSMGFLDLLDYDAIGRTPKLVIGLSDPTALLLALHRKTGLVSVSGQMVVQLFDEAEPYTVARWWDMVAGPWPRGPIPLPGGHSMETLVPGEVEGPIFPVNLSLFTSLLGTPYLPDLNGAILVVEDIDERPEGLDRMVSQMHLAGLDRVLGGIVLAQFTNCLPRNDRLTEEDGLRVVWEWAMNAGIPAITRFPYGHESICCSLPLGARARLTTNPPAIELSDRGEDGNAWTATAHDSRGDRSGS